MSKIAGPAIRDLCSNLRTALTNLIHSIGAIPAAATVVSSHVWMISQTLSIIQVNEEMPAQPFRLYIVSNPVASPWNHVLAVRPSWLKVLRQSIQVGSEYPPAVVALDAMLHGKSSSWGEQAIIVHDMLG